MTTTAPNDPNIPVKLIEKAERDLALAIMGHFRDKRDHVQYSVTLYPLPTEDGWAPSLMVYMMIQPQAGVDGIHMGEFTTPYEANQELMNSFAEEFARRSLSTRQKQREASSSAVQDEGVAVTDVEG